MRSSRIAKRVSPFAYANAAPLLSTAVLGVGRHSRMNPIPENLHNSRNQNVLAYLSKTSAHSDVAEALLNSCRLLGDSHHYCPDPKQYLYVAIYTRDTIFGFATGMSNIAFRLDNEFVSRAIATGANQIAELDGWVSFELFRNDWPSVDLKFWALKSYAQVWEKYAA